MDFRVCRIEFKNFRTYHTLAGYSYLAITTDFPAKWRAKSIQPLICNFGSLN